MSTTPVDLPVGTDWEIEWDLEGKHAQSGALEPRTGLTVTAFLSLVRTPDATPIHAALSVQLTERAEKPGTYAGVLDQAALREHLAPHLNTVIYEVCKVEGDAFAAQPVIPRNR